MGLAGARGEHRPSGDGIAGLGLTGEIETAEIADA